MASDKDLLIRILGDSTSLKSSLTDADKQIKAFAEKIGSIGKTMTVVGGAITAISVGLVKMASDAEETSTKFAVVFKDVSDEAAKTAKNLADNFGLSTKAAKQLLSDTGDLLTGFGFTGEAALDLSTKVNELAVDLASFTNYSGGAEGASAALTKALLGERESVKSLGISIMETDVQAKVLQLTQQGMRFETERQAKAYATLLIAQEQSKNAIGDFSRTSEGFANQMRILKARVNDVVVALGEKLLPIATSMVGKVTEVINHVNNWIEAHEKLTGWIVKTGAILGGIALVGGPILMAAAAFMKVKTVIDSTTFALKLLNIRIGATSTLTTGTLVPSLSKVAIGFGIPLAPIALLGVAVVGLYAAWKTNLFGMRDITIVAINDIKGNFASLVDYLGGGGGGAGAFSDELGKSGKNAADIFSEFNFDEWVEENRKAREAAEETAKTLREKFNETLKSLQDRLYELTHTEMENHIHKLNEQKQAYIDAGMAIEDINEWYKAEINKLDELYKAEDKGIEQKNKLADAYKTMGDEIFELTHTPMEVAIRKLDQQKQAYIDLGIEIGFINKWYDEQIEKLKELYPEVDNLNDKLKETAEATKQLGILGGESFSGFTTQIKHATTALSNFTKEGVAAAVASIYMKFYPAMAQLREDLKTTGFYLNDLVQAQIKNVEKMMSEQIAQIYKGWDVYQNVLEKLNKSSSSKSSSIIPSYQTGIRSVPETQLALVHRGEEINPPGQRSYDQRKNYSTVININSPIVRNDNDLANIKRMVEQALDESKRNFLRRGSELALGM